MYKTKQSKPLWTDRILDLWERIWFSQDPHLETIVPSFLKFSDWRKRLQKESLILNSGALETAAQQPAPHIAEHRTDILGNTRLLSPFLSCSLLLWNLPKFKEEKRHGLIWRAAISWRFISLRAQGTTASIIYNRNYKAFLFYFMSRTTWYGKGRCYSGFRRNFKTLSKLLNVNTYFPWNKVYVTHRSLHQIYKINIKK